MRPMWRKLGVLLQGLVALVFLWGWAQALGAWQCSVVTSWAWWYPFPWDAMPSCPFPPAGGLAEDWRAVSFWAHGAFVFLGVVGFGRFIAWNGWTRWGGRP